MGKNAFSSFCWNNISHRDGFAEQSEENGIGIEIRVMLASDTHVYAEATLEENDGFNKKLSRRILLAQRNIGKMEMLRQHLLIEGFFVDVCYSGTDAIDFARKHSPDLIVSDLIFQGMDGLSVCRNVRSFSDVPFIMVSANCDEIDVLLGFEMGADDFISESLSPREIVARVKAVLRRMPSHSNKKENPSTLSIDLSNHTASYKNIRLDLTTIEFRLLKLLYDAKGQVLSRQNLIDALYSQDYIINERTIDTHIRNIRKKLGRISHEYNLIHSVYGEGYKWHGP